ncbi:MAG: radical SAM family RiPP maturation amino acid epimerase [Thermoanaerobaculia bacterium]
MSLNRPPLHRSAWTTEEISQFSQIKRFMERFQGDPVFRTRLPQEMQACSAEYGFNLDPETLRCLWDVDLKLELLKGERHDYRLPPLVAKYRDWIGERLRWREHVRNACAPQEPRWRSWRERQMNRAQSEMGEAWSRTIIFDTAAIELSKGCSVGCWFCGVDAPRLEDHFYYTPENARFFRGVLEVLVDLVGAEAASAHFLYWASDPLDNPDYEQYCQDYRDVIGVYPLTTTALPLRDPERTHNLLRMLMEDDSGVHRFSILTLKQLNQVHQEFSPEELARVELCLLNPESILVKANAGRFRKKAETRPKLLAHENNKMMSVDKHLLDEWEGYAGPGTIACVSGLLLNLVERTVKLITPCKANDRWPLGYIVFGEGKFETPSELRSVVESIIGTCMTAQVPVAETIRFRQDLSLELSDEGFAVFTPFKGAKFGGNGSSAYFKDLGAMVGEGTHSAGAIADRLLARHAIFHSDTYRNLDWMFDRGLLHEEPPPPVRPEALVHLGGRAS